MNDHTNHTSSSQHLGGSRVSIGPNTTSSNAGGTLKKTNNNQSIELGGTSTKHHGHHLGRNASMN